MESLSGGRSLDFCMWRAICAVVQIPQHQQARIWSRIGASSPLLYFSLIAFLVTNAQHGIKIKEVRSSTMVHPFLSPLIPALILALVHGPKNHEQMKSGMSEKMEVIGVSSNLSSRIGMPICVFECLKGENPLDNWEPINNQHEKSISGEFCHWLVF
jgi:hypothetical protein